LKNKLCNNCNVEKSIDDFPKNRRICKNCFRTKSNEYKKKWKKENREKYLKSAKEYNKRRYAYGLFSILSIYS